MMNRFAWPLAACLVLTLAACTPNNVKPASGKSPAADNVELGILYMREGKKSVALEILQKAVKQDPNSADAHNAIAVLYESINESAKADEHFKRALSLDPKDSQSHNNYASFLCRSQRFDEAEQHYLTAASNLLYETPYLSYTNAGSCAYNAKDLVKAEKYWRKALEISPKFSPALLQMARLNVTQKNYLGARAYLQRFHAVSKPTPESLWLGIQAEHELGDKNAEASYSMLLKNGFPDSPQAKQLLGH